VHASTYYEKQNSAGAECESLKHTD